MIESYEDKGSHYIDPSGDSIYSRKSYFLNNNDRVDVVCFDMSKAFEEEGKSDRLAVTLDKREFINFIDKIINENFNYFFIVFFSC